MPNTASAKKALRQSVKRSAKNSRLQEQIDYAVKRVRKAVAADDKAGATTWLLASQKALDKAAQKRVIKKNTASRRKSRLAKVVNATTKS